MKFATRMMVLVMVLSFAGFAFAVDLADDGKVDVFIPLTVVETTELDFGAVNDSDGSVTLNLLDAISVDASAIHAGGTTTSGVYTFSGTANQTIDIALAANNANGLNLTNFTTDLGGGTFPVVGTSLDGAGDLACTIGADLTVVATTAATGANQSLNFTFTVTYN